MESNISNIHPSKEDEEEIQRYINEKDLTQAKKKISDLGLIYKNSLTVIYYDSFIKNLDGDFAGAIKGYKKIIGMNPNVWIFQQNLGLIYFKQKKYQDAAELFEKAIKIENNKLSFHYLGCCHYEVYEYLEAKKCFQKTLDMDPKFLFAQCNLSSVYIQLGDFENAKVEAKKAVEVDPKSHLANNTYGIALSKNGTLLDLKEALNYFNKSIEIDQSYPSSYANLSSVLYQLDDINGAVSMANKALEIDPDNILALQSLSTCSQALGDNKKTEELHKKILKINPNHGGIFKEFCLHSECSSDDDIIKASEYIFNNERIGPIDKAYIGFGLFYIYDKEKKFDKAFEYLQQANNIYGNHIKVDMDSKLHTFSLAKKINADLIKNLGKGGCKDETPIFILGMPRSGTTLTEQILSSHSKVDAGGEKIILNDVLSDFDIRYSELSDLSPELRNEIGSSYVSKMREATNSDSQFIVDKVPQNFIFIGIINIILPNAKIIHLSRNPMDNCLSIYSMAFVNGQDYSYSLDNLAKYYNSYRDIMLHWKKEFGKNIFDLSYEGLVDSPEDNIKKMLNYCGLVFEENCLSFHKNKRAVLTPSSSQVRKKMYKTSLERWKNYEKQLLNFKKKLEI